jgi:hypothetical protein
MVEPPAPPRSRSRPEHGIWRAVAGPAGDELGDVEAPPMLGTPCKQASRRRLPGYPLGRAQGTILPRIAASRKLGGLTSGACGLGLDAEARRGGGRRGQAAGEWAGAGFAGSASGGRSQRRKRRKRSELRSDGQGGAGGALSHNAATAKRHENRRGARRNEWLVQCPRINWRGRAYGPSAFIGVHRRLMNCFRELWR